MFDRVLGKDFNKGNPRNMMASSDFMINVGGRPNKGGKLPKENIHASDGDKYMSYIKVRHSLWNLWNNTELVGVNISLALWVSYSATVIRGTLKLILCYAK